MKGKNVSGKGTVNVREKEIIEAINETEVIEPRTMKVAEWREEA